MADLKCNTYIPPVTWELGFSGDSTDTIWETAEGAAEDDKAGNLSHHQCWYVAAILSFLKYYKINQNQFSRADSRIMVQELCIVNRIPMYSYHFVVKPELH